MKIIIGTSLIYFIMMITKTKKNGKNLERFCLAVINIDFAAMNQKAKSTS